LCAIFFLLASFFPKSIHHITMGPMKRKKEEGDSAMDDMPVDDCEIDEAPSRLALFAAVEGDGTEHVLSCRPLVKLLFREAKQTTVLASIQSHRFHKGHARRFFAGITSILNKIIQEESYVPASAYHYESDDNDEQEGTDVDRKTRARKQETINPSDLVPDPKSTEALDFLKASALCVNAYLEGLVDRRAETDTDLKMYQVVDEVFGVAELLHSVLFSLHSCGAKGVQVQTSIASVCELWWHQRFVDREALVVQLLPLLVVRSLDASAQKSDVKRLFHIREALAVLDFDNESITYLQSLLLRTVSSPLYLRVNEGKRFIAGLFHLHNALVSDLRQAIRVQIPDAKKTILQAYGEIYFRAWKDSETHVRTAMEERALQDLMYAVVHVANPTMVKSIHTVLAPFHDAQKNSEVESLMHRMYGPILWRSIKAANPRVRINAAAVLAVTFPLKASSMSHKETEQAIQKGTKSLKDLLTDSDPRVRVAGSEATATVLTTFWDVLPVTDIRMLLNRKLFTHVGVLFLFPTSHPCAAEKFQILWPSMHRMLLPRLCVPGLSMQSLSFSTPTRVTPSSVPFFRWLGI
jgi:condensin-2 complex subunit G2